MMASTAVASNSAQRLPLAATGRPNQHFELGVKGRKTGWAQTKQVRKDADGLDNVDDFFQSDDEDNINVASRPPSNVKDNQEPESQELEEDSRFFDESFAEPQSPTPDKNRNIHQEHLQVSVSESRQHQRLVMESPITPTVNQHSASANKRTGRFLQSVDSFDTTLNGPLDDEGVAQYDTSIQKPLPVKHVVMADQPQQQGSISHTPVQFVSRPKIARTPQGVVYSESMYPQNVTRSAPRQSMDGREYRYQNGRQLVSTSRKSITPQQLVKTSMSIGSAKAMSSRRPQQHFRQGGPTLVSKPIKYDHDEYDQSMEYRTRGRLSHAMTETAAGRMVRVNTSRQTNNDTRGYLDEQDMLDPYLTHNQADLVANSRAIRPPARRHIPPAAEYYNEQDEDNIYYTDDPRAEINPQTGSRRIGMSAHQYTNVNQFQQPFVQRRAVMMDESDMHDNPRPMKRQRSAQPQQQFSPDYHDEYKKPHAHVERRREIMYASPAHIRQGQTVQHLIRPQQKERQTISSARTSTKVAEFSSVKDEDLPCESPLKNWSENAHDKPTYTESNSNVYYDDNIPDTYPESDGENEADNFHDSAIVRDNPVVSGSLSKVQKQHSTKQAHSSHSLKPSDREYDQVEYAQASHSPIDVQRRPPMQGNGRKKGAQRLIIRELDPEEEEENQRNSSVVQPEHAEDSGEDGQVDVNESDMREQPLPDTARDLEVSLPPRNPRGRPPKSRGIVPKQKHIAVHQELDSLDHRTNQGQLVVKQRSVPIKKSIAVVSASIKQEGEEVEIETDGARRSRRTKVQPVAYWKNERVIYGRRVSGFGGVPTSVKEVIRIPSDDETIAHRRSRAEKIKKEETEAVPSEVSVFNYRTGQEELHNIVVTPGMIVPRTVGAGDYRFQKVFSEGDFLASGVLALPRGAKKPIRGSGDSAMIFLLLSGQVQVRVNETSFVISHGSQFFVPRGNLYEIENIANREARLFFCHGKEVLQSST
ncbi:mitotic fidelity of chromosome transmission- protein [Batrachochytrium dendrobatidis]